MTDVSDASGASVTLQIFDLQTQIDPATPPGLKNPSNAVQDLNLCHRLVQQTFNALRFANYELSGDGGI